MSLTPVEIESKLRQLYNDLGRAQQSLAQARDLEVDAKHAHDRARRRAVLSEKSPKVTRGGYTAADRDAWVDEQVADLRFAYDKATVVRETAQDHLRTVRDQTEIVRSLSVLTRLAYEMAGIAEP